MAINIKPDISLGVKPPATMSLPEMLNLARGSQAYQRESEVFPELVEQSRIATRTAKIGELSAGENLSKTRADKVFSVAGGFINDPRIASGDRNKTVEAMLEIQKKAISSGVPEAQVVAILSPITATAAHNPAALPQMLANVIQAQIGPSGQQSLQTPQIVTSGGQSGIFRAGPATVTTLPMPGNAPAPAGVTPADMTAPIQPRPAAAPAAGAAPTSMVQPDVGRLPLIYDVRKAGVPYSSLPQEETDRTAGSQYRNGLVQRQSELTTARRNLQEVVKTAQKLQEESVLPETGPVGAVKRKFADIVGDPTYKQLSKDLANVQISNIKAVGGSLDTVGGQQLIRMASGDETFPPDVLLSIARRADADITNLDMMATGMQRHTQKFGDANAKRFQQMWSSNADSRIFEIMNIARDVKDVKKREELTNKLLGGMDDNQRKDLFRQYNNLIKLTNTGDL
ncbi:MAG: hypothetical protein AN484_19845 [Aphanizomenon flos-aquae WA102]|uniref:Uncharacterized protein n=1 Tax=Aphanizomenon flos-aquae WA102 TaxID=1710896 RepID=A0A1B7WY10_APHFL|nr:MAG: hypothetical protein AN484_19845 [Aphanizomenon flos-aquae WA102]